jgi:FkbM family methyltransferase
MALKAGILRRLRNVVAGRDLFQRVQVNCPTRSLGSDYGGWSVATTGLGPASIVYSFGVGEDISFDTALIEAFGMPVHAFDPTPRSAIWLESQSLPAEFMFHPYGLADHNGTMAFYEPKNRHHVSHSTLSHGEVDESRAHKWQVRRLDSIMNELGHQTIDVLKMDIEGGEYAVIDDLCRSLIRPTQILVEFHHHFPGITRRQSLTAIRSLQNVGYRIFSISATAVEYGFLLPGGRQILSA